MLDDITQTFFGPSVRLNPLYLLAFVGIAFAIFAFQIRSASPLRFLAWLFPLRIYLHASHLVDIKLFALNRLLALVGFFGAVGTQTLATVGVASLLLTLTGGSMAPGDWSIGTALLVTAVTVLVGDFCTYWIHRAHHEVAALWPFHAVHHSAEVLTPVTVYRKHPAYDLLSTAVRGLVVGAAIGVLLVFVTDRIDVLTLGGTNAAYFLFHALGSNFRHSHVWIGYGRVLEHVLVSPAQHQIHHSRAVEHHDRNYGEVFALWDWMFGTLVLSGRRRALEFGLSDRGGVPIEQPHPTLARALLVPFRESLAALAAGRKARQAAHGDGAAGDGRAPQP